MKRNPLILVMPSTEREGVEFSDASISLSNSYTSAIIAAGGLPLVFPATIDRSVAAEAVQRCDGVLLTGGDDIEPKYYAPDLAPELLAKLGPLEPERDIWEKEVIAAALAQGKPMLGICRGFQMLNVALGGTLIVDIPTQVPHALNHRQMARKTEAVHDISIEPDSLFGRLTGQTVLGVNSTHHQGLGEIAKTLRIVAKTSDGIVEGVELKDPRGQPFLLAVQFHPERLLDRNPVFRQVFVGFVEACARSA